MINIKVFKTPIEDLEKKITLLAKAATKLLEVTEEADINLVFVQDKEIQNLNKEFRSKDKVTDILSFNYEEGHLKGEIYICTSQAEEQSSDLESELLFLLAHGILHIFGYTHNKNGDEAKMNEMIERILVEAKLKK